jgi:2-dehydropantoate 2-reductase
MAANPQSNRRETVRVDLSRQWKVTFRETGISLEMDRLESWSGDARMKFYPGQPTYRKSFDLPMQSPQREAKCFLDFSPGIAEILPSPAGERNMRAYLEGPIRENAQVYVNDMHLDTDRYGRQTKGRVFLSCTASRRIEMARVAVVGVGAIGGAVAGLLQTAGRHEILLCTRRPLDGLTVTTPEGFVRMNGRNLTDPARAEAVDWVMIATKTYDAEGAAAWLRGLAASGAPVAVIQNGVEHRERFSPWVKQERTVPVVIDCPVERQGDGTVVQRGVARMKVEDGQLGREFAELFRGTRAEIEVTEDWKSAAWRKLCVNAVGALNALTLKPAGVFGNDAVGRLAVEMVDECAAVGRAEGARLDENVGQQVVDGYRAQPRDSVNSMLADRLAGRRMEIDARNGVIVRLGEKHGIATPLNRMTVAVLTAASE